jgi:hypothetical protein
VKRSLGNLVRTIDVYEEAMPLSLNIFGTKLVQTQARFLGSFAWSNHKYRFAGAHVVHYSALYPNETVRNRGVAGNGPTSSTIFVAPFNQ